MAKEIIDIVKSSAELIASAAVSSVTMGASVALAAKFLGNVAASGVSLASEMAETIDDITHYFHEGRVIVTMGPESKSKADLIGWLVM